MRDVSQTSCSSSSTGGQEGQGHPWKQRLRRNTTPGTPQTPALGTRGQHPKTPRAGTGPEPCISPLDSNNIPELPQLRLLSLGRSRRKKTLPSFRCIPQNAQDRGTPRPSSVRTLRPYPGLLVSPPVPPCPPDAPVSPPGPRSRSPGPLSPPGPLSTARNLSSDIPGPCAPRACAVPPHQRGARRELEFRRAGLQLPWCSAAAPRAPWRPWRPRRGGSGRSRLPGHGGGSGRRRSPGNTVEPG